MAGAKPKVTPAVPAEGETLQSTAEQENENRQQAADQVATAEGLPPTYPGETSDNQEQQGPAPQVEQQAAPEPTISYPTTAPEGLPSTDTGEASDNQEQQEPAPQVKQQASQELASAEALVGLFERKAIKVVAKCETFRRAGRVFTRNAQTILLDDLTEDEFKQLYDEPMLAVQFAYLAEED